MAQKKKYTAGDFFRAVNASETAVKDHVTATATQLAGNQAKAAATINSHTTTTANALAANQAKAAARIVVDVNDHTDAQANALAGNIAQAAARVTSDVNDHIDARADASDATAASRFAALGDTIDALGTRIITAVTDGIMPLWYTLLSILIAIVSGWAGWKFWFGALAAPTTTKDIVRDAAGNGIDVTIETSSNYPAIVPVILAIALGALVLGILWGLGSVVAARIARNRNHQ